jgi:hypothetical protein
MFNKKAIQIIIVTSLLCITTLANAESPLKTKPVHGLAKTTTNDVYLPMLINNIFNFYSNNGDGSFNRYTASGEGFEFPKGNNLATVIFEDGVVWGCKQNGNLKVGGSTYWHGLQAGRITTNGTATTDPVADDPASSANRLYRVRRDLPPIAGVTNPDDLAAASELAIVQNSEVALIGRYETGITAETILSQYWADWNQWPASQGAPFNDVNHDGIYDPTVDIPSVPQADQTMWYVANDLDVNRVSNLSGSLPIGIEMQKTIWAYNIGGAFGNTIYTCTKLINKSGKELDSMYVAQWADPDNGNSNDDYVGCDTTRSLGYVYNGVATDANFATYGFVPPAAGYDFLQGPMVKGTATDTAIFDFQYRPGFKNLPMTAFNFFINGNATYADPTHASYSGTIQWYNLLRGLVGNTGAQYINPNTGLPTTYVLSGDPVTSTGWIDGTIASPADRRIAMCSGPFTMAAGDTQEVVVATIAGRGADYRSSITVLKTEDDLVQKEYNILFRESPAQISSSVTTTGSNATIAFRADARNINASAITITLKTYTDSTIASVTLADDGLHNDETAGDQIFGGSIQIPQQAVGLYATAAITYQSSNVISWAHIIDHITTTALSVTSYAVASDNINEDGIPNPGENVRYIFSLKNNSSFGFSNLNISAIPVYAAQQLSIATIGSGATTSLSYNQNDPTTYLAFNVPQVYPDSTFTILLTASDSSNNQWIDTLVFPVRPFTHSLYNTPLAHATGFASGNFSILIVDSTQVKNHLYIIRGVDSIGVGISGYTVKDSTTGTVLIQNHPLPDALGHTSPIVDGFKLLLGTIDTRLGMTSWTFSGTRQFSPVGGFTGIGLEGFSNSSSPTAYDQKLGTIGAAINFTFGSIGTTLTNPGQYHTVLLKLAAVDTGVALWNPKTTPADTNFSLAYRYLRHANASAADPSFASWIINTATGYPYQDFNYAVPFSAWDMDANPPVRLAVGMFENNDAGASVDGRYWPPVANIGDNAVNREFCFIFNKPYSTTPDPALQVNLSNNASMPLMWVMTCTRRSANPWIAGDQFEIIANHLPSSLDMWTFTPTIITSVNQVIVPTSFTLSQNYPNPFNPATTIRYDLPMTCKVTLKIYNILGQEIRTLGNDVQNTGQHFVIWDSKNAAGIGAASGIYFVRFIATPMNGDKLFSKTMKMLLIK